MRSLFLAILVICLPLPAAAQSLERTDRGYRPVENEDSDRAHAFRINLLPNDFEAGETVVLEYTISFTKMPARFLGQIEVRDGVLPSMMSTLQTDTAIKIRAR